MRRETNHRHPPLQVAIVGGGFGAERAPFGDPAWECWGVNATWRRHDEPETKFHWWFELHRKAFLLWEHQSEESAHLIWLRSLRTLPVYVQRVQDFRGYPTVRPFPFAAVQELSPAFGRYHACSIDWMIAYAISVRATAIALYGVEQDHTSEPVSSRACVEFWSGFAVGRGITVTSDDNSTFRLAQMTYTDTPYALDATWLPRTDQSPNSQSTLARMARALRRQVTRMPDG